MDKDSLVTAKGCDLVNALEKNLGDVAKKLLLNGYKVNSNNESSITPLHYAAKYDNIKIANMLLNRNAKIDAKDKYSRTSLHYAVEKNHIKIVKFLLNRKACVNVRDTDGLIPLHIASKEGFYEIVKILLNYGSDMNATSYLTPRQNFREGYTPLHYAVEKGSQEITELLLKNNKDVNIKALRGTSLHIAAEEGYPQIVKDLLNCGACVNSVCTSTGYTPLHLASERGNTEVVCLLLINGANVNAIANDNRMPLYLATEKGHGTIVKLLLEHGAVVNSQDNSGDFKILPEIPLHIAARKGYRLIIEYLLNHGASANNVCTWTSTRYTPLHIATSNDSMAVLEQILSKGADVNAVAKDSLTSLYGAIEKGHRTVVRLLLEHGVDVDTQNQDDKTVLHSAVERVYSDIIKAILMLCPEFKSSLNIIICDVGEKPREAISKKIVKNLLQFGFPVNTKDNYELVHSVVILEYLEIFKDFLKNAIRDKINSQGFTLLHTATIYGHEEMAELLISCGADVNAKDRYNNTIISLALRNHDLKMIKLLLTNGATLKDDPEIFNIVVREGSIEIIEIILQRNKIITQNHLDNRAFVNAKNDGTTALHIATHRGKEKIVEMLLKYGAEVDSRVKYNMTPLHVAAQNCHLRIIEILLKYGADIDAIDAYGRTAFHIACEGGNKGVVVALLQIGADVNITSRDNLTALDFVMPNNIFPWQFNARYNDDDDYDYYEEYIAHVICRNEEIISEILLRHIVKMMKENLFVNVQYLHRIEICPVLTQCYICCKREIRDMENEKLYNNVSFYDILISDEHQLAIYTRNKQVVDTFKSRKYYEMFPMYADLLETQFKKGEKRNDLVEPSIRSINSLFGYELPFLFIDKMCNHLSNFDLKNLIHACP